ncbi:MAG: ribosome biogenesis GTP-binding protein YihA/YsxC [bacterium]
MSIGCRAIELLVKPEDRAISNSSKVFQSRFIGSFFELKQLPKDRLPQIAIAGRSNVGKSSLLNRLLGSKKLAKVSATPGKTRSLNFFLVNDNFYMVDLPGYGYAKVPLTVKAEWNKLVKEYLASVDSLVGLILLLDCRRETTSGDNELITWLAERQLPVLIALTKADKLNRTRLHEKINRVEEEFGAAVIASSAVSGMGKKELVDAIREAVGQHKAHDNG